MEGEGDALAEELGQEVPQTSFRETDILIALGDYITDSLNKAVRDADARTKVSHDSYQWKHMGKNAGKTPDERVDNLSKAIAAGMMKAAGVPFDLKTVREQA